MAGYRRILDRPDLSRIHSDGVGFVMDPSNRRWHRAACRRVANLGLSDKKWFAEDDAGRDAYIAWRQEHPDAQPLRPCAECFGRSASTGAPPRRGAAPVDRRSGDSSENPDDDPFVVVHSSGIGSPVEVWSQRALSFDAKPAWQKRLVEKLRAALCRLPWSPDLELHATYGTDEPGRYDIENRLFYNVGSSAFSGEPRRLSFERLREVPEERRPPTAAGYRHYATYDVRPTQAGFRHWKPASRLTTFERVPVSSISGDQASRLVWWAMKTAGIPPDSSPQADDPIERFGLSVVLHLPPHDHVKLTSVVKPIFDGVIGSFHQGCSSQAAPRCSALLAPKLRTVVDDPGQIELQLTSTAGTQLPGPAFKVHSTWVQLDPLDELCDAGELTVSPDATGLVQELSGELFRLEPRT